MASSNSAAVSNLKAQLAFVSAIALLAMGCASKVELEDKSGQVAPVLKTGVQDVIRGNLPRVQNCYNDYVLAGGKKSGKQIYQWDITKTGRGMDVKVVADDIGDKKLTGCISGVITSMAFPALDQADAARIKYPFVLSQPKSKKRY